MAPTERMEKAAAILCDRRRERMQQDHDRNKQRNELADEIYQQMQKSHDIEQRRLKQEWRWEDSQTARMRACEDEQDLTTVLKLLNLEESPIKQEDVSQSSENITNSRSDQLHPSISDAPQDDAQGRERKLSSSDLSDPPPDDAQGPGRKLSLSDLSEEPRPTARRRMNKLTPRTPTGLQLANIPQVDKSAFRKFEEMKLFSSTFLSYGINFMPGSEGWVIPFADGRKSKDKQRIRTKGAIWLLSSEIHHMLPAEIGDHGYIVQFRDPQPIKQAVPLFIAERNAPDQDKYWYAGQYTTSDGEQILEDSDPNLGTAMYWARKLLKLYDDDNPYYTGKIHRALVPKDFGRVTATDILDLILPKGDVPAKLEIWVRILRFKSFNEKFYQSLVDAAEG